LLLALSATCREATSAAFFAARFAFLPFGSSCATPRELTMWYCHLHDLQCS